MGSDFLIAPAGECVGDIRLEHTVRIGVTWLNAVQGFVDFGVIDRLRQRYDDLAAS